jgi:hypothetical protein
VNTHRLQSGFVTTASGEAMHQTAGVKMTCEAVSSQASLFQTSRQRARRATETPRSSAVATRQGRWYRALGEQWIRRHVGSRSCPLHAAERVVHTSHCKQTTRTCTCTCTYARARAHTHTHTHTHTLPPTHTHTHPHTHTHTHTHTVTD